MKRRVAPRLLTSLIATVLVGSAAMPGAAVAETPDATTLGAAVSPVPQDQQPDTTPSPSPEATTTPTPAPTPAKPSPSNAAQSDTAPSDTAPSVGTPAPSPTSEAPKGREDSATPAESDVMPDGPLKRCITPSLAGKEATLVETSKLTSVSVEPTCAVPGSTPDPSELPAMDDWAGAKFLSGVTSLTVTGFDGVTVPRTGLGGLAKIEKLSLADNRLTELPDLGALPELKSLDLVDNDLTELTMPSAADAPQLTKLDVSKNQISDVSATGRPTSGQSVDATGQELTHPDITARAAQQLADVITVPAAWVEPSWEPGAKQMAEVDGAAGTFSAARPGTWSLSWAVREGEIAFSGTTTGESIAPEPQAISFTTPGIVAEGESATYRADVSDLPASERSDLNYQWYRGSSKSTLAPVDGATEQTFTIDSVSREDDGTFVKLVAEADGVDHQSAPALLAVQPVILDDNFRECVEEEFDGEFDDDDLAGLRSLDCSGRGIDDVNDLPTIDGDGNVSIDLSDNLISDISLDVLVSDDGTMRTKQINLSDNRITEVTDLGDDEVDLSDSPANLIVLDGNQIQDVSGLGNIEAPDDLAPAPISVRRQVVDLPAVEVGATEPRPKASSVSVDDLPLTRDGQTVDDPVTYPTRGVETLEWDGGSGRGVAFTGSFVVPVGSGRLLGLIFPTDTPTGGDRVTVRAYGFTGDTTLALSAIDEELFAGGAVPAVSLDINGSGAATFTLGYTSGPQVVTATGQPSNLEAMFDFDLSEDEVVDVPDDALRACILDEVGKPDDDTTYRSRLNRITTDFSCRSKDVKDLTGLREVPAPSIDLTGNDVTSLETVPALNLATTSLSLINNELQNLGEVANQPTLQRLNLSQNQLRDLFELDDVTFAGGAEILAVGQTIALPQRVVGERTDVPDVTGLREEPADLDFPDDEGRQGDADRSFIWSEAGDQRIDFALRQAPRPDEEDDPEEPDEAQAPGLELAGSFLIRVVSAPPVVQPQRSDPPRSDPPAQQAPPAAAVQTLAPVPLVERVQPEDDDPEEPQAVALGPEVALQETSPTPRVVTNPTVEKREPITSMSGWGLTATGWSLLGAALLAMALAVGIAVLTLGRSTR